LQTFNFFPRNAFLRLPRISTLSLATGFLSNTLIPSRLVTRFFFHSSFISSNGYRFFFLRFEYYPFFFPLYKTPPVIPLPSCTPSSFNTFGCFISPPRTAFQELSFLIDSPPTNFSYESASHFLVSLPLSSFRCPPLAPHPFFEGISLAPLI